MAVIMFITLFSQGGSDPPDSGGDPFGWDFNQIDSDSGESPVITTPRSSDANPFGSDSDPFGDDNGGGGSDDGGGSGSWFGSGEDDDDTWEDDEDDDFFG